jgi:hypothetical protein
MEYTLSLNGPGGEGVYSFTSAFDLNGLQAGNYRLCLEGVDVDKAYQQQCFDVVIASPPPLEVQAVQSSDGGSVFLELSGASIYRVELNGVSGLITSDAATVTLKQGINHLTVESIPECRGSYQEVFLFATDPILAPNPFSDYLEILIPMEDLPLQIALFNASGALVYTREWDLPDSKVILELPGLPTGLYLLQLRQGSEEWIYKVFRQ